MEKTISKASVFMFTVMLLMSMAWMTAFAENQTIDVSGYQAGDTLTITSEGYQIKHMGEETAGELIPYTGSYTFTGTQELDIIVNSLGEGADITADSLNITAIQYGVATGGIMNIRNDVEIERLYVNGGALISGAGKTGTDRLITAGLGAMTAEVVKVSKLSELQINGTVSGQSGFVFDDIGTLKQTTQTFVSIGGPCTITNCDSVSAEGAISGGALTMGSCGDVTIGAITMGRGILMDQVSNLTVTGTFSAGGGNITVADSGNLTIGDWSKNGGSVDVTCNTLILNDSQGDSIGNNSFQTDIHIKEGDFSVGTLWGMNTTVTASGAVAIGTISNAPDYTYTITAGKDVTLGSVSGVGLAVTTPGSVAINNIQGGLGCLNVDAGGTITFPAGRVLLYYGLAKESSLAGTLAADTNVTLGTYGGILNIPEGKVLNIPSSAVVKLVSGSDGTQGSVNPVSGLNGTIYDGSTDGGSSIISSNATGGLSDVYGVYEEGTAADTVYSVDVSWGSLSYTYTAESKGTWNPETHTYDGSAAAAWSCAEGADQVKVTNHSNAGVTVALSYTPGTGYSTIGGQFTTTSGTLGSAVGTTNESAPALTSTLALSGVLADTVTADTTIGQVTVSISGTVEP